MRTLTARLCADEACRAPGDHWSARGPAGDSPQAGSHSQAGRSVRGDAHHPARHRRREPAIMQHLQGGHGASRRACARGVHSGHHPRTRSRCSQPHASVDSISAGRSRHPPTARADARARGGAHRSRPTRSVARPSRPGPADAAPGLAAAVGHGRAAPTHAPTKKSSKMVGSLRSAICLLAADVLTMGGQGGGPRRAVRRLIDT